MENERDTVGYGQPDAVKVTTTKKKSVGRPKKILEANEKNVEQLEYDVEYFKAEAEKWKQQNEINKDYRSLFELAMSSVDMIKHQIQFLEASLEAYISKGGNKN